MHVIIFVGFLLLCQPIASFVYFRLRRSVAPVLCRQNFAHWASSVHDAHESPALVSVTGSSIVVTGPYASQSAGRHSNDVLLLNEILILFFHHTNIFVLSDIILTYTQI